MYAVTDPVTGRLIERFPTATDAEIDAALARAHAGFLRWREVPLAERAAVVARASELFRERSGELAEIIITEMGKTIGEAMGELGVVVDIYAFYAEHAERLLREEELRIVGGRARLQKLPVGALLGIMPWNYPQYQVARFAGPNLVLGNTVVLKHAPSCPRSAAAIEALLRDAGLPADAYVNVYATNEQVARMIADPRIQGVSVTGSERAGSAVAAEAGRNLKKVVLELGGSDPMIVLDTPDLDDLVEVAYASRMGNMGQACNAPKRMIVMDDLYDEFVDRLTRRVAAMVPGDPRDPATEVSPLSSNVAADRLAQQIARAVEQGATLRIGGGRIDGDGAYVEPAVLTDVRPGMDAYHEELFGPVATVFRARSEEEAVELANDTPFGLGASVFSADTERAARVAERIEAGMVYINSAGGSQADLPFGGVKRSGFGRELGDLGIEEFMNKRVIRIPDQA